MTRLEILLENRSIEKGIPKTELIRNDLAISVNTWNKLIKNTKSVSISTIKKVANYFSITNKQVIGLAETEE